MNAPKAPAKTTTHFDPDDFFGNSSPKNNSREQNENRAPYPTTKASAKQYYLGNSRYKPGVNPRQTVRRDSFNWFSDPTNNSNSASTFLRISVKYETFI